MPTRVLLSVIGTLFGVIAWHTSAYPPTYLALADVWAGLAGLTSLAVLVTALHPHRAVMALAGALLVCSSSGRAVALLIQMWWHDPEIDVSNYAVASAVWTLIAVLGFVVWVEYVAAWSSLRRVQ